MNAPAQARILNIGPADRYVFNDRCYEVVKTAHGHQVVMDPPPSRLWRWCDWRLRPQGDAASAEKAFWRVVTAAIARRPHMRHVVFDDAKMIIAKDRLGYHVAVFQPGHPLALNCGDSWRRTIETCAAVAGELLDRQPRVHVNIGHMQW